MGTDPNYVQKDGANQCEDCLSKTLVISLISETHVCHRRRPTEKKNTHTAEVCMKCYNK